MSDLVVGAGATGSEESLDLTVEIPPEVKPVTADERIAHRGPIQRLLVSPEIGAIVGAVLVWAFFWGNGETFGTAASTLIIFDAAAPLGIMAVVVALLMIGGEFDLSAGMMTGATGIMVGLMVKYFAGDGAPMWMAVGAAFLAAGAIGLFNGTLVNKTGLPSFIVTLATFFVLKGVTLVLAKRLEGKVSVADVDNADGFKPFYRFFGYEYKLETFSIRNGLFLGSMIVGAALLAVGLAEQSFTHRSAANNKTLPYGLLGVVAAVFGFVMLHKTDGVRANAIWGIVAGLGCVATVVAFCMARYIARTSEETEPTDADVDHSIRNLGILGAVGMVLAYTTPFVLDRNERREILTWFPAWVRVASAVLAAVTGVGISLRLAWPGLRERMRWYRPIQTVITAALTGLIVMVLVLAFFELATVQALRAIAMMGFSTLGLISLLRARARAGKVDRRLQLAFGLAAVAAIVVLAFIIRADAGAVRFRTGLFAAMMLVAIALLINSLLEASLQKRRVLDAKADRFGRRMVILAVVIAGLGMTIRLIFTNASETTGAGTGFSVTRMSIFWWVVATAVGAFVLTKTKWGNWIFAVGGNKEAARAIGVPANKVKVGLFVTTSLVGCFVGIMVLLRYTSVQASQGDGLEFIYIIAAVVGGNLMTGGYGSVIGASVGALIIAMSNNGIGSARWNSDGRFAFNGSVLLIAVLVNNYTRKKAQEAR